MNKQEEIKKRSIKPSSTILDALKVMDKTYLKLLILLEGKKFIGLVSIGDIQRAIVRNVPLTNEVVKIMRKNVRVSNPTVPLYQIMKEMLKFRMEMMPVVDNDQNLIDVYFWEEFFDQSTQRDSRKLDLPLVIMAGGIGSRLRPLTNVIPKPLIPLSDKPIIEDIIDSFVKLGVKDIYLSANYKFDMIKYYFDNIPDKTYNLEYILEDKPLGTAGSLHLISDKIKSRFFLTNCDTLINQDYRDILDFHLEYKHELTLVSSIKTVSIPYGTLNIGNQGELIKIDEKPDLTYFINAGMYIIEPHLLKEIPEDTLFNITDLIENILKRKGKVGVFPVGEKSLVDIGNWAEYLKIIKPFSSEKI